MLTKEQKSHLKSFNIDVDNLSFEDIIDEVIKLLYLYSSASAFNEQDFLRREIKRLLKPNN